VARILLDFSCGRDKRIPLVELQWNHHMVKTGAIVQSK